MEEISLYIHIPFCLSKCKYCDFTSFKGEEGLIKDYIQALIKEIDLTSPKTKGRLLKTVFFGGGTPSAIDPNYIKTIMEAIRKNYRLDPEAEITLEANPGTITREKALIYRQAGINRVSMGAQSFDDEILSNLGRIHQSQDIYRSVEILRKEGLDNINLDLMFGLPNQSLEQVLDSINQAIDLGIPHISNYSLILEEATVLYKEYRAGIYQDLDEDLDRAMYEKSNQLLREKGYRHYEISNFAKAGYESRHNLVYWEIRPYLGLGLSSHSNLNSSRFSNTSNIRDYIDQIQVGTLPLVQLEPISRFEEVAEYAIMGFRKIQGISLEDFRTRFGLDFLDYYKEEIDKNLKLGLVKLHQGHISLTQLGLNLSNQVEVDFYKIENS